MTRHSKHRLRYQEGYQKRKKTFERIGLLKKKNTNIVIMGRIRTWLILFYDLMLLLFVNEEAVVITIIFRV